MSKIHRVKTQITNGQSLVTALQRLGIPAQVFPNLQENRLALVDYYHNTTMCAVKIERADLAAQLGGRHLYGGLGWVWNGTGYDLAVDHIDTYEPAHQELLNRIHQEYARAEVYTQAEAQGYLVQEETLDDGTVRLLLNRY